MKLNYDLIREILAISEDKTALNKSLKVEDIELQGYSPEEINYHIFQMSEAGLIDINSISADNYFEPIFINYLTWDGHQFLENIRDNNVWNKTKKCLSKVSSASLNVVACIAKEIVTKMILENIK